MQNPQTILFVLFLYIVNATQIWWKECAVAINDMRGGRIEA